MKNFTLSILRLGVAAVLASWLMTPAIAQQSPIQLKGVPDDWSSHYRVFSNPGTEEDAIRNGTHDRWLKIVNDPRYILQQLKRHAPAQGPASEYVAGMEQTAASLAAARSQVTSGGGLTFSALPDESPQRDQRDKMRKDWSASLLTGAVLPNAYPTTWALNYGTPSCASDFAVYPTGSTGSSTAATIIAYNNLYTGNSGCTGGPTPEIYWAYKTGAYAVTTSPVLSLNGEEVAFVQSTSSAMELVVLKWAATPAGRTVTSGSTNIANGIKNFTVLASTPLSSADVGAGITGTGIPTGDTIATVTGTTTGTLFAAATGNGTTHETLHITADAAGPATPSTSSTGMGCTAPCMTVTTLSATIGDSYSSPYYDYSTDALYVGDNASHLYKITPVFDSTASKLPAVSTATLNSTPYDVATPIYDSTSGCVFVGDSEGYLYSVSSGIAGTVCTSTSFAFFGHSEILGDGGADEGIFDAPLVDSSAKTVYAFVTSSALIGNCGATYNCIVQFTTSTISSGSTTAAPAGEEALGTGHQYANMYAGAFDNVYYSSSDPPSGNIYVVGGTFSSPSTLYQVPINSNSLGAASTVASLGNANDTAPWASPVNEFCNPGNASACAVTSGGTTCGTGYTCTTTGTDYIFFSAYEVSLTTTGGGTACSGQSAGEGCVIAWIVNNPNPAKLSTTPVSDVEETFPTSGVDDAGCWGTGGFVIDNASTATGASNIYFPNMNGNSASAASSSVCNIVNSKTIQAVQASQTNVSE